MPVFVEWRWKEQTKSFLVIFHFYDDFSSPNLRIKKYEKGTIAIQIKSPYPEDPYSWSIEPRKVWMTWAPSHPELGLLMELLSYANIINGLKETEKRKLKIELQGRTPLAEMVRKGFAPEDELIRGACPDDIKSKIGKDKKTVVYFEPEVEPIVLHFCVELCPEYIDYLKTVLKPYL